MTILRELENGLVLRSLRDEASTYKANLVQFYYDVFVGDYGEEDEGIRDLAEDILHRSPVTTADDVWVITDPTADEKIVAALLLIPQTWFYEDIEIGVGRIELVGTHPDYRRRGLIRELMNTAHERSASLGHLMQSITGIPYYYRKFGYNMTVDLGGVGTIPLSAIGDMPEDPEFTLVHANDDDIPLLIELDKNVRRDALLSAKRTAHEWHYELHGRRPETEDYRHVLFIQDKNQNRVGYVVLAANIGAKRVRFDIFVVNEKTSHIATYMPVMQAVKSYLQTFANEHDVEPPLYIGFDSSIHPDLLKLIDLTPYGKVTQRRYAWYLRVPDLAIFIMQIKPVLERRLVGSAGNRYTGEIKLNFREFDGLLMKFEDGKLVEVKNEAPEYLKDNAAFPYLSFLDLLFGYRDMTEITRMYIDAYAQREIFVLLDILFPKKTSSIMPIN